MARNRTCSKAIRRRAIAASLSLSLTIAVAACGDGRADLFRHLDAQRLASQLTTTFLKASEAAGRAVLADTNEASAQAAREATDAEETAARLAARLRALLELLDYKTEQGVLRDFGTCLADIRKLDAEILPLASENTNLQAQRLAFGAIQADVDRVLRALEPALQGRPELQAQAEAARSAVLEIQVLEARHIAEADEANMARIEARMDVLGEDASTRVTRLRTMAAPVDVSTLQATLDELLSLNRQVVELSRRNSNVRSLALTIGRKRVVAAQCEDTLRNLEEQLAGHGSEATR